MRLNIIFASTRLVMRCLFTDVSMKINSWKNLKSQVIGCRDCPRLVAWREKVSLEKRRAYSDQTYWGKPVPGFGDRYARVLILGLAPGAHGSNRTGRMFTGDASGDFLFPALFNAGFCSHPVSTSRQDDLKLNHVFITAVCRCVPPGNKPTKAEQANCSKYLLAEINLLKNLKGIVALGGIAFNNAIDLLKNMYTLRLQHRPKFEHGKLLKWRASPMWLLSSYHPSRQNTQTGLLTQEMFSRVWSQANKLLNDK